MPKKLPGFFCFKISSKRLAKSKFNIKLNINDARRNGELIKVGDSALLEVIRRVTGKQFDKNKYDDLHKQKSRIMKQPSSEENKNELLSIMKKIDDMLLIDALVEVQFQNKSHYQKIYDKGLFINDKEYVRILAGAANLRQQKVFFIDKQYYEQVTDILNCGRNVEDKLNPAKFSAYWGLYNSASHSVSFPKFIVIPDYEYTRMVKMDWIDEHNEISEVEKEVAFNAFDGQGLCSPRLSKIWAKELGLSHTPSTYIIRAPFLKGQICVFDIHEFANYVARNNIVKDIWGKDVDINDVDLVISQSQFKLWSSYPSQRYYEQKCLESGLGFRISRYSQPFEKIKEYSNTNYMFIQVLDLDEKEIEELCKPTIEYFKDLMGGSREKMLTYLYPDNSDVEFDSIEPEIQALMLDERFSKEPHIQKRFVNSLRKKIKEAQLGSLIVAGNFQAMVADPYAQCEWIFNLSVDGLLEDGENYSRFWNDKNVSLVGGARSPLTHFSEFNKCKLVDGYMFKDWYQWLDNAFILSSKGIDTLIYADGDFDGDLVFTTSNSVIINGITGGNPISYDKPKADKMTINKKSLFESDGFSFGSHIGFITNISSTFHSMLKDFEKGSLEYLEIHKRLKMLRMYQGFEIDSAKLGGFKKPIPEHWTKWQRIDDNLSDDEKEKIRFENSIIADKRPKFMIHIYSNYIYDYKRRSVEREYWARQFGCSWEEIKTKKNISKEETDGIDWYRRRFPYIENNSVMNIVEKTCSSKIKENQIKLKAEEFDYSCFIKDKTRNSGWVEKFHKTYKYLKSSRSYSENASENVKQAAKIVRDEMFKDVSSDVDYILDCVLLYFYETKKTRETEFIWKCFGKDLINRLVEMYDEYSLPVKSSSGDFYYLWEKYYLRKIPLVKNEENR